MCGQDAACSPCMHGFPALEKDMHPAAVVTPLYNLASLRSTTDSYGKGHVDMTGTYIVRATIEASELALRPRTAALYLS